MNTVSITLLCWFLNVILTWNYRIRIAGILGARSGYPCPICLVPKEEQFNLGSSWPARTKEATDALVAESSRQATKKSRKALLDTQSLRWLPVCALLTIACRKCLIKFHRTLSSVFLQHGLLSSWLLYWTHCTHLSKESLVNISGCGFWSHCPILPSQKLTHGECCSFCARLC